MSNLVVTPIFVSRGQGKYSNEKMVIAKAVLPSSYPASAGIALTPANFGLTQFACDAAGATVDPISLNVTGAGGLKSLLASCVGAVLRLFHPTGGLTAAASAAGVPILNAGGTTATASAATGPFLAGVGKEVGDTIDVSGVTVTLMAFGH